MLRDSSDSGIDGGLLDGFTMEDIDLNTLKTYRIEYERHNPDHVWNNAEDKEFLRNLGAYTVERTTKKGRINDSRIVNVWKRTSNSGTI